MLTSSARYPQVIAAPHKRAQRIQVFHSGVQVADSDAGEIGTVSGSVDASLLSRVSRTFTGTFAPQDTGPGLDALLDPAVAVLRVSAGVEYADGLRELFPIFTGRVQEDSDAADGSVTARGDDWGSDVIAFRFERPENSNPNNLIIAEIRRLIRQAVPSAVFGTDDVVDQLTPVLTWDEDRGQALDDLAAAVKGRWYALGDGSFVVRAYPYATSAPVVTLTDGIGGLLTGAQRTRTRDGVANSVTVVSERMDGTDPVQITARNIDASSPTFFGETYGYVSQIIRIQTPLTVAGAQQLANEQLTAASALSEQWSASLVPDYRLEPGDTAALSWRGRQATQVIDRMSYPLGTADAMTLTLRASIAPLSATTEGS